MAATDKPTGRLANLPRLTVFGFHWIALVVAIVVIFIVTFRCVYSYRLIYHLPLFAYPNLFAYLGSAKT